MNNSTCEGKITEYSKGWKKSGETCHKSDKHGTGKYVGKLVKNKRFGKSQTDVNFACENIVRGFEFLLASCVWILSVHSLMTTRKKNCIWK